MYHFPDIRKVLKTVDAMQQFYGRAAELESSIREGNASVEREEFLERMEQLAEAISFFSSHPTYQNQLDSMVFLVLMNEIVWHWSVFCEDFHLCLYWANETTQLSLTKLGFWCVNSGRRIVFFLSQRFGNTCTHNFCSGL